MQKNAVLSILFAATFASAAVPLDVETVPSDGMITKTFLSPPVNLRSGQIANTPTQSFGPLDWPAGPIAMKLFKAQVVDDDGNDVPLSEVYVHHWLIYDNNGGTNYGVCAPLPETFGIGAELRGTWYEFPGNYAVTTTGEEKWTANLHLIRTTNVPDIQSCIECICPDSQPPLNPHGNVGCCQDGAQCWGMQNSTLQDGKNYYLQYTIGYTPISKDTIPISILNFDVTAKDTYDCQVSYDIPALQPGETHVLSTFANVTMDFAIVLLEVHQHIGGLNYTVDHYRDGKFLGQIATHSPRYGSKGRSVPGNESDYLVAIPTSTFTTPYQLKKGDQLRLESVYGPRSLPSGYDWHAGVMGLVFLFGEAKINHTELCDMKVKAMCGPPPYVSSELCLDCLSNQYVEAYLENFKCDASALKPLCNQTAPPGTIPTPSEITDMTLSYVHQGGTSYGFRLTGPQDSWFAIAYNPDNAVMDGADAYVYRNGDQGVPIFERRLLGNHAPGNVTYPSYPHGVNVQQGVVEVDFAVDIDLTAGARNCFLFAHGDKTMELGYHGSNRGLTCLKAGPGIAGKKVGRVSPVWASYT